jgi:Dehydrogenases with different specificities (related to short-chain alcohol dehydrogenases)
VTLAGRRILVTGASGGIGAAVAAACLAAGASVVAQGARNRPEHGEPVLAPLNGFEDGRRLAAEARADGLVHCAARQDFAEFHDPAPWPDLAQTNLAATHGLLSGLAGRSAVLLSSVEGTRPAPGHAAYAATKAGLEALTKSAAHALAPMRVNAVAPGLTARPGLAEAWPEGVARWRAAAALGREVTAEEVAAACLFLLSDAASGVTGAVLTVDAGVSAGPGWLTLDTPASPTPPLPPRPRERPSDDGAPRLR